MDSFLDSCSSTAEPEYRNHLVDDLIVGSQLAVRGNSPQQFNQLSHSILINGRSHWDVGSRFPVRRDLDGLEKILINAGIGTPNELGNVRADSGLGLFLRSIVGLDREAAKRAFDGFLTGKTFAANQIQFVNLIIDCLTQSGWMTAAQLYESPFTDFSPKGVGGVFGSEQVLQLVGILKDIRNRAAV